MTAQQECSFVRFASSSASSGVREYEAGVNGPKSLWNAAARSRKAVVIVRPWKLLYSATIVLLPYAVFVAGIFAGGLDRAFVGLRAGIGEEHLLHAGSFAEHLGEQRLRLSVVEIRDMLEFGKLGGDGRLPDVVGDAEAVDGDAGPQVDIFFSGFVIQYGKFRA
jgi:hypothetical protein